MSNKIHPTDKMTSRQRMLAAYRGLEVDRLPYWAKVANPTWRSSQPENIKSMTGRQLLDYIFADGIFGCGGGTAVTHPHVKTEENRDGIVFTKVNHTPDGDLIERWQMDPYTNSWHPIEFPIKTVEDIKRFRWLHTDAKISTNDKAMAASQAAFEAITKDDRGVTTNGFGPSPFMHLLEHCVGPVNMHYMLADHTREMEELLDLMNAEDLAIARHKVAHTPADVLVSVENTSTTLHSPAQFAKYPYPQLCSRGKIAEAAGKMHELHMCGLTFDLLEKIDTIPAASIEAYTSPTLGNTRLVDGRKKAPSKTLIGGTNVNTWLLPLEKMKAYIVGELDACPNHRRIVLTTAGVAPPACSAETFRAIGEWIHTLPVRM